MIDLVLALRFASTAEGHRRLAASAETEAERLHWQLEAERFEELAELAKTDSAEARRRYRPTKAYDGPTVAEYVSTETAYGQTTKHPYTFRAF
jgi:hypothetical protein